MSQTQTPPAVAPPVSKWGLIGYGFGDVANNFAFALAALFLLTYYVDVAKIPPAYVGIILLMIRFSDAFMDIVAGRIVDATQTRFGRFRPFLLLGAVPLMLMNVAVFSVPNTWSLTAKVIYAVITYGLLNVLYSMVNIPYGALATAMTQDTKERAWLATSRTIMASATFVFIALVLGNRIRGAHGAQAVFTETTLMLAVLGVGFYLLCFSLTREVVKRTVDHPNFAASVKTLLANKALFLLCLASLAPLAGVFSMVAGAFAFARYDLGGPQWFSAIIVINLLLGTLIGAPIVPVLVARIGKKMTFITGCIIAAVGFGLTYLSPPSNHILFFAAFIIASMGSALPMTVVWALEADTVEYGEWSTGLRCEGLNYSLFSFTRKTGQAIGGSVPAFVWAASGYVGNAPQQSAQAMAGLHLAFALVPAGFFVLAAALMSAYPLTDARYAAILSDIRSRAKSLATAA